MREACKICVFSVFTLAALLIGLSGTGVAFAKATTRQASMRRTISATCSGWSIVSSPNVGTVGDEFLGVAADAATDAWSVGNYFNSSISANQTLVEHWNGTSWSVVSSPNASTADNYLFGVTAISTTDAWAVGEYFTANQVSQTLIEQWNGTNWSVVPSPNIGTGNNRLASVAAVSASDVWAVGAYTGSSNVEATLIEQWNGTSWSVVHSPNKGSTFNYFNSVTADSAGDVWAVGNYGGVKSHGPLIERWNGTSWQIMNSIGGSLNGVAAVSSSDVWAVGNDQNSKGVYQTLTKNWNSTRWNVVSSPNLGTTSNILESVAAVSASDVWAVGYTFSGQTLIEQWNGTSWSIVSSPNAQSGTNELYGVAASSANNVWAVGDYVNSNGSNQTLIEYYC